jgi:type IX secretion system PorP/SprF family membrane protein
MKYYILNILLIGILLNASNISGQQMPRYSQYIMNEFLINPAVAGYDGRTSLNISARKELLGFASNTPETYSFSAQSRILKKGFSIRSGIFGKTSFRPTSKGRVGLGVNFMKDVNIAMHRIGFQFTYAYHIFVRNSQLSFGLAGSIFQFKVNGDDFVYKDPDDIVIDGLTNGLIVPDANFGVNFMTQNYHVGLSVSQLFKSSIQFGKYTDFNDKNSTPFTRHYYILGAYRMAFFTKPQWEVEYSTMIRITKLSFKQTDRDLRYTADLSAKFLYSRQYWAGLSFRTSEELLSNNKELILTLGVKVGRYYLGYAFDYGLNNLSRYTIGSHEIALSLKFGDTSRRYRWLERY